MRIILWLFLLVFWGGVAMIVLANMGIIAVSPWLVVIVWLIIMGLYFTGLFLFYKKAEEYETERKIKRDLDRIEETAERKVAQIELDRAKREAEMRSIKFQQILSKNTTIPARVAGSFLSEKVALNTLQSFKNGVKYTYQVLRAGLILVLV